MKYEVLTYTLCDGYINCWTTTENVSTDDACPIYTEVPTTFDTEAEAQAEIDEMFEDIEAEIKAGAREPDEGYDRDDFVIVPVGTKYVDPMTATLMHLLKQGERK